ncbi:MAG: hypothetical protein ACPHVN_00770 [Luminiphilus sp.]
MTYFAISICPHCDDCEVEAVDTPDHACLHHDICSDCALLGDD